MRLLNNMKKKRPTNSKSKLKMVSFPYVNFDSIFIIWNLSDIYFSKNNNNNNLNIKLIIDTKINYKVSNLIYEKCLQITLSL